MTGVILWASLLAALLGWCAAAVVGCVSVLIHPRQRPESPGEAALYVCRAVAYVTAAVLAGLLGIYAILGLGYRPSTFVAVIIAFALVGLRMRHDQHGTGDSDAT